MRTSLSPANTWMALLTSVVALAGCSTTDVMECQFADASTDSLASDVSTTDAGDAKVDAASDGPVAADAADAADVVVPPDSSVSCNWDGHVDWLDDAGVRQGLTVMDVGVSEPLETAQTTVTPDVDHYQKAIGVLYLTPNVMDAQVIAHMLRPMGLPYAITQSPKLSVAHDMSIFFPEADPTENFNNDELDTIQLNLQKGLTLVLKATQQVRLMQFGGIQSSVLVQKHRLVNLTADGIAEFPTLDQPNEQQIMLAGPASTEFLNTWELTLVPGSGATVLGTFEDGTVAIAKQNVTGGGVVYTYGVDFRDVVLRSQLGHALYAGRAYINVFEPLTDAWMLMMRDIYDQRVQFGVRLSPAPAGSKAVALFAHDVDTGTGFDNAITFATYERSQGISSSFFFQTKYVSDLQDTAFYEYDRAPVMAQMLALGHSVGSDTVAHSGALGTFPVGDGTEAYPAYLPYNVELTPAPITDGGTLFGELRVSKSLIDALLPFCEMNHDVLSFRAGELSYHPDLPQTMERMGYRFDSSRAIGDVMNNFPYRQMIDWDQSATPYDTSIFEFPVTIEDELPPRIDQRAAGMVTIIGQNADNGAPSTIMIHPDVTGYKLAAEEYMVTNLPAGVVGQGLDEFGAFWRARDQITITAIDYDYEQQTLTVVLTPGEDAHGITLRTSNIVKSVTQPPGATLSVRGNDTLISLPDLIATQAMTVVMTYDSDGGI